MGINAELLELLRNDSLLFDSPIHGVHHWRTVERNGLYLSQFTGADPLVVSYFAYFHDCMRENEGSDSKHGPRGARYAERNREILGLSDAQFEILHRACSGHTYGRNSVCETISTCWDADRLDLGRVGISPRSNYLFSREAKRIADDCDFGVLIGSS